MVSNAPVSEYHCLALPADVKSAHWSELRGGASAKSKPGESHSHSSPENPPSVKRDASDPKENCLWGWGEGQDVLKKEISGLSSREGFWLSLLAPREVGGCLLYNVILIIQGLIIHFMESLALCLSSFSKFFLTFAGAGASRIPNGRKKGKRIKIILPHVNSSHTLSDQGKGASCVVKLEPGAG